MNRRRTSLTNRRGWSRRVPIQPNWQSVRFDHRFDVVIVVRGRRYGRVIVRDTEIAFGHIGRLVRCRMHGHARVPNEEREKECKADTV